MTPSTPKPIRARGDAPADERTEGLTRRQRLILVTINDAVAAHGYPPTMREIGDAVGLTSSSSVAHQLQSLERKGFLRRDPKRPRAMEVVMPDADDAPAPPASAPEPEITPNSVSVPRDDHVWLMPHNPAFAPILGDHAEILGKVVAVLRTV